MTIRVYSYPYSIKFDNIESRVVDVSKMKYLHDIDMELTLQKRYSRKWKRHIIDFPPELNASLEDMARELANLTVGHAKVLAQRSAKNFNISTPDFLGIRVITNYDQGMHFRLERKGHCSIFVRNKT